MSERGLRFVCERCRGQLEPLQPGGVVGATAAVILACRRCGAPARAEEGIWRFGATTVPAGFPPERRDLLEEIESTHFWFPPRRRLLRSILDRGGNGSRAAAAIELGCGTGSFLPELAARYAMVVGIDAYAASLRRARERASGAILIEGDACSVPLAEGQFDLAVALDVLEHNEPARFLDEARRLVHPAGRLLLSVPAAPSLWSQLDVAAGHRCRYTRATLEAELAASDWRLEHHTHYQALLLPVVWMTRRIALLRRAERRAVPPMGRALGALNELEVALFARHRLPFGTSLIAVAGRAA